MERGSRSPSPTPSSSTNVNTNATRPLNATPRAGFRPLRMATSTITPRPTSIVGSPANLSPRSEGPNSLPRSNSPAPRLGTIQKIGRKATDSNSHIAPTPRSPAASRFTSEARNSSVYSIKAESESTHSPKSASSPLVDEPLAIQQTESPLASPTSNAGAFASLSAALGLDLNGDNTSTAMSSPRLDLSRSSSGYSDVVIDDDDASRVGVAIADSDIPSSAQTATFPTMPAPPPIIGSPPSPGNAKARKDTREPTRLESVSLASEGASPPLKLVDTPQFQAVDLGSAELKEEVPQIQSADPDKKGEESRVQSQSSDTWDSRQSTLSTMTTLSLGGKSIASSAESTDSARARKVRPDSLLLTVKPGEPPLIYCVAVVDFNHLVGPRIEFAYPPIPGSDLPPPPDPSDPDSPAVEPNTLLADPAIQRILPFLALPDGAHLSAEDYAYFHVIQGMKEDGSMEGDIQGGDTVFGISCNRQLAASELLTRGADVTRSTVQKALVVLARKPLFGAIRDRLGVVTRAFFGQRDFSETGILVDFYHSLEKSLRSQLTESSLYMGTSLRELVHKFRHRTLTLLKLMMLQKRIMFYGHPVERLCTYQYSLVSLVPGLLLALEDAGAPAFDRRAGQTERPSELRTSDRKSMLRFMGLPLNLFGGGAFFQPYMPLQQVDMLKSEAWLCGTTNTIVTQQKNSVPDLLVNLETGTFEFSNPTVERQGALTAADRKFIDDLVRDVNEGWNDADPSRPLGMQFKGSDDYLRAKFEEYIYTALSTVKYADFLTKGKQSEVLVPGSAPESSVPHFNDAWVAGFRMTRAYDQWNRITDPVLFDIIEPKHPCAGQVTLASDLGLRLSEGLNDLKLEENLGPARDRISNALSVGSAGFFKAVEGFRSDVASRIATQRAAAAAAEGADSHSTAAGAVAGKTGAPPETPMSPPTKPVDANPAPTPAPEPVPTPAPTPASAPASSPAPAATGGWGSFFASKAASFRSSRLSTTSQPAATGTASVPGTPEVKPADVAK
ncbi:transport protein Avl9-domain-containing protein [Rhizoctonia solani]|nr:transport protein Avl9-domain-containing protein [Rhizoctonia solani]